MKNSVRVLPAAIATELVTLYTAGKWAQLVIAAGRVTTRYPRHPLGWQAACKALLQLGKVPEAIDMLSRVVKLAPDEADGYNDLGNTLHATGRTSFGGVTRQIVCDNLKAGVTAACRYEPGISRTYQDMANHYGTAVLPARVRRPRDKAKVEVAVQVVQRWVLARLRYRRFFSLAELNGVIRELVTDLNDRPMRHLATSRRALFRGRGRGRAGTKGPGGI